MIPSENKKFEINEVEATVDVAIALITVLNDSLCFEHNHRNARHADGVANGLSHVGFGLQDGLETAWMRFYEHWRAARAAGDGQSGEVEKASRHVKESSKELE